jgi:hypothetical protein
MKEWSLWRGDRNNKSTWFGKNRQGEPMTKTLNSSLFGLFKFDADVDWFEVETTFASRPIQLTLNANTSAAAAALLANAEAMAADDANWMVRLENCAAGLVDIANEWNDEQDGWAGPIDIEGFIAKITLESLVFQEDGFFEAYFRDGDLFWGHSIMVTGTMADGPQEAATAG